MIKRIRYLALCAIIFIFCNFAKTNVINRSNHYSYHFLLNSDKMVSIKDTCHCDTNDLSIAFKLTKSQVFLVLNDTVRFSKLMAHWQKTVSFNDVTSLELRNVDSIPEKLKIFPNIETIVPPKIRTGS